MGDDNAQTTQLLRMRVQGACIGYCLPTGEFLFATKESPKHFVAGSTDDPSTILYGDTLLSYISSLDIQRLKHYIDDVQTQLYYIECGQKRTMNIPPILTTIATTHTPLLLESLSTPLTLRLQRCIDAVQSVDYTRRFSDESTFVIDDDDYRSIIANDALQVSHNTDEELPINTKGQTSPSKFHAVERASDASLADFAFDFQEDWDRVVVDLDELTIDYDFDKTFSTVLHSPVAISQI